MCHVSTVASELIQVLSCQLILCFVKLLSTNLGLQGRQHKCICNSTHRRTHFQAPPSQWCHTGVTWRDIGETLKRVKWPPAVSDSPVCWWGNQTCLVINVSNIFYFMFTSIVRFTPFVCYVSVMLKSKCAVESHMNKDDGDESVFLWWCMDDHN